MLLLHQVGSVKIGEVVRYTVTYTPSQDRILPSPEKLFVRIRNTSAIALRAAFVHGPYTLSVSTYPSSFDPNEKFTNPRRYGVPVYEPMLKAGGSWECELVVPDDIRQAAGTGGHGAFGKGSEHDAESASWVLEVSSQVIFSTSVAVGYELAVARDRKSLGLSQSLAAVAAAQGQALRPGKVADLQQSVGAKDGHHPAQPRGVFSRAVRVTVEDTAALWNTPRLPGWDDAGAARLKHRAGPDKPVESVVKTGDPETDEAAMPTTKKKIHLVILTHGLHSNLGADMLFIKESIDAAAKRAKIDARTRRQRHRQRVAPNGASPSPPPKPSCDDAAGKPRGESVEPGDEAAKLDAFKSEGEAGELKAVGLKVVGEPGEQMGKLREHVGKLREHVGKPHEAASEPHAGADKLGQEAEKPGQEAGNPDGNSSGLLPDNADGDQTDCGDDDDDDDDDDDEDVIVRGYSGNATKTEKGIKYLGKRLARYILSMAYPDQPYLPIGKVAGQGFSEGLTKGGHHSPGRDHEAKQAHKHSAIKADVEKARLERCQRPYRVTSISFVGHSLGGLVQMYAIAYIQKHSPQFFDLIKPVNFIALASPFLGLSNENPLYVKFALDFGLVGRTGQDLGLTWRAPTIARSGWGALVSNLGESAHKRVYGDARPESKPLLRILPTGPAHTALRKFRNRTVYSNVVNDGIVPLRTSCLLFLDWQGLGRVEKARRDAGLVETVVGFGWAELTGTNMVSSRTRQLASGGEQTDSGDTTPRDGMRQVPQPPEDAVVEDDRASLGSVPTPYKDDDAATPSGAAAEPAAQGPLAGFFNLFRSNEPPKEQPLSQKQKMILRRGQTMPLNQAPVGPESSDSSAGQYAKATSGHELEADARGVAVPPKTTFFESAGDLLNPSMPSVEYLLDPSKRPRTIFHDRVYHPADIPPPPMKKRPLTLRRKTFNWPSNSASQPCSPSDGGLPSANPAANHADSAGPIGGEDPGEAAGSSPDREANEVVDGSNMRVEEKIARGYHRDLSWRKVLVKLEPDAHNNICVRRMFANAYGWPVIKHLADAHFSDSAVARMRTEDERLGERALDMGQPPDEHGGETKVVASSLSLPSSTTSSGRDAAGGKARGSESEAREALDEVTDLPKPRGNDGPAAPRLTPADRADSMTWSERDWIDSDNDSDGEAGHDDGHQHGGHAADSGGDERQQRAAAGAAAAAAGGDDGKPGRAQQRAANASSWNWAEKIVGKGGRGRSSRSPGQATAKKKTT